MNQENLEDKCKHQIVKGIEKKKLYMKIGSELVDSGYSFHLGRCYYCHNTVKITDAYRKVVEEIYELKPKFLEVVR